MSLFYNLIIFSFFISVFLLFVSNFLYQKLTACIEEIKEMQLSNEGVLKAVKDFKSEMLEHKETIEEIEQKQNNLKEGFKKLETSFQTLKQTAVEIKSAQQTKKAILDFMKG